LTTSQKGHEIKGLSRNILVADPCCGIDRLPGLQIKVSQCDRVYVCSLKFLTAYKQIINLNFPLKFEKIMLKSFQAT
jgi:hypothetical protein